MNRPGRDADGSLVDFIAGVLVEHRVARMELGGAGTIVIHPDVGAAAVIAAVEAAGLPLNWENRTVPGEDGPS